MMWKWLVSNGIKLWNMWLEFGKLCNSSSFGVFGWLVL